MHGSVVRSWLLELTARALAEDRDLAGARRLRRGFRRRAAGRLHEAIDRSVPMPVLTAALFTRFRSRDDNPFAERLLAALRQQFGGHAVKAGVDGRMPRLVTASSSSAAPAISLTASCCRRSTTCTSTACCPTNSPSSASAGRDFTDDQYREFARDGVQQFSRRPIDEAALGRVRRGAVLRERRRSTAEGAFADARLAARHRSSTSAA